MRLFPIRLVFLSVFVALAACDSPSPRMMSGERHEAVIAGSAFTVYRKGDEVEVYRTTPEMLPRLSEVFAKAEQAIRQTTGCAVKDGSLVGDAALMRAELDCG
jgi:hypothetical protein